MTRGSRPRVCVTCGRCVAALVSLFVNGLGWIDACHGCADGARDA